MIYRPKVYSVESVTSGHPDKVCDQISDAILDACLEQDPMSRVGAEAFGSYGLLVVGGEITTKAEVDFEGIAREVYREIGHTDEIKIITNIVKQSPDIAQGVNTGGAGDQGIMYGYATDETPEFMPKGVSMVHKLTQGLENLRKNGEIKWLKPDGKAQITIANDEIKTVLVSTQHDESVSQEKIREELIEKLIKPTLFGSPTSKGKSDFQKEIEILINPTGKFVKGGFEADAGLTGRKIMVDTYGGLIPHGGGCFSGKDPTKVDRSAAYMARFVAKNIVAGGKAKSCLVSVSYAIGRAEPLMVEAIKENGESLSDMVTEKYDFKPLSIIERLDLRRPIYKKTAAYGHFGREGFPWEEVK
jgi:S-adenosylmethionine synthetase